MTTHEEWLALAKRCEEAKEPDRGHGADQRPIDWAIYKAAFGGVDGFSGSERNFPCYTASLDAITELIGRKLSNFSYFLHSGMKSDPRPRAALTSHERHFQESAAAATPTLALCAAFCRAMAERGVR